jgi:archaeal flagellin FlaB
MNKLHEPGFVPDERAEVGVGTMTIFIAVTIVSAAAAGVVLETADDVTNQAEITGEETLLDVSTGYAITHIYGDRQHANSSQGIQRTIQYLELTMKLQIGSPSMRMNDTLIEIADGSTRLSMTFNNETSGSVGSNVSEAKFLDTNPYKFSAVALLDSDGSFVQSGTNTSHVVNYGDVVRVFINCSSLSLPENTAARIWITPRFGYQSTEWFRTPDTYLDRYIEL